MTENSSGQPGGGYGGFYAPPAGGAAPVGPSGGPIGRASATEALAFGWRMVFGDFTRVALPIIVAAVAYGAASFVISMIDQAIAMGIASAFGIETIPQMPAPGDLAQLQRFYLSIMRSLLPLMAIQLPLNLLLDAAAGALFIPGICEFSLRAVRGEPVQFGNVFGRMKHFGPMFIAGLLLYVVSLLSSLACFFPWFIAMSGVCLYAFCVVDRGASGSSALGDSWRLTRGAKLSIFGFFGLMFLVYIACFIACCLPTLLVATPVFSLGMAHIYASLSGQIAAPPAATS